jgi:hypothetical protein
MLTRCSRWSGEVLDWLAAALRGLPWASRRIKRHALDRHDLVREGSAVVTPVIEFVSHSVGAGSIMFGSNEFIADERVAAVVHGAHAVKGRLRLALAEFLYEAMRLLARVCG